MSDEREDLDNLVRHPGWLYVQRYAQQEFSEKILAATEAAANEPTDAQALNKLRQLIAGKRAVQMVLAWPTDRLRQLTEQREREARGPSLPRGGR